MQLLRHSITVFLLIISHVALPQERIEPPFWWSGMQEPELQIMLFGEALAEFEVKLEGEQIEFMGAYTLQNKNYLFVSVNINNAPAQEFKIILTKRGTKKIVKYKLLKREKESKNRPGFNSSDAIYLITPDRFVNGSTENDNIEGYSDFSNRKDDYGRHGGDIKGICDRLEYIKNLGFTAIWLNPLLENNMPKASYHGYATTDFYKVDPRFGSNKDYRDLVAKAEKLGLKVIMDQIVNHIGSNHWWMKDLPDSSWLNNTRSKKRTNHIHQISLDPHKSTADYIAFKDGWFVESMPDLNQQNQFVAKYLSQNSIWWVEFSGISGIRMDTYPYADTEFIDNWSCDVMNEYPNFNIVGEEWTTNPIISSYWQRGSKLTNHHSCLPTVMDFPVQSVLARATENQNGIMQLYETLTNDHLYGNLNNLIVFGDNHDMDRLYKQVNSDFKRLKIGLGLCYTLRGLPQIYCGTELLFTNAKEGDHGEIRQEFSGGWKDHSANALKPQTLTKNQTETQDWLKTLGEYRQKHSSLQSGKMIHFVPKDGVYVFFRINDIEKHMIVVNTNKQERLLNTNRFIEIIKPTSQFRDINGNEIGLTNQAINLAPQGLLIVRVY